MSGLPPLVCTWDGDALVPRLAFKRRCDENLVVGEFYRVETREERSINSHRHFFASIDEAWRNLAEDMADRFPTPDHLRRWLLIKCGYRDERTIVTASRADALRFAAFVRPMDGYAVVVVRDAVVFVWTAKSQSTRAMGRKEFKVSKDKVLDECAKMIGISTETLRRNAGRAA